MIAVCSESSSSNQESRSGVFLNYAPEDTLRSFLTEEHFAVVSSKVESEETGPGHNNLLRVSEKPPKKQRRPFLRKNQGRAAWSCRLQLPREKFHGPSTLLPSQTPSSDATNNVAGSTSEVEGAQRKTSSFGSTFFPKKTLKLCPQQPQCNHLLNGQDHSVSKDECLGGNDPFQLKSANLLNELPFTNRETDHGTGTSTVDHSVDGELEEFELLERFTENQSCNGMHRCDSESHQLSEQHGSSHKPALESVVAYSPTCTTGVCGSIELKDNRQVNKNKENHGLLCFDNVQGNHFARSPACRTFESDEVGPMKTPKPVSADFDDQVPWKDEHEIVDLPDTNELCLNRQRSYPSLPVNTFDAVKVDTEKKLDSSPDGPPSSSSAVVKVWISRLEAEVNRFNLENAALAKLKAKNEEDLAALEKARKDFEVYKETTIKEFETYRLEEINKLKKERKVLSEYHRSLQSMPRKRDREEIERLRQQIFDEKTEASQREIRLQQQNSRQRARIDELTAERTELLERIKRLEQARFSRQNSSPLEGANRGLKVHGQFGSVSECVNLRPKTVNTVNHEISQMQRRIHSASSEPISSGLAATSEVSTSVTSSDCLREVPAAKSLPPSTYIQPTENSLQQKQSLLTDHLPLTSRGFQLSPVPPDCNGRPAMHESCHPDNATYPCSPEDTDKASLPDGAEEAGCRNGQKSMAYFESAPSMLERSTRSTKLTTELATLPHQQEICSHPFITSNDNQPLVVEESCRPDGMSVRIFSNGDKVISLPNGQQEVHCEAFKSLP
uniref:Tcp10_C domain-containing protein n=1 Tax=Mesocestoides corti TaxID=53468 RepID=A0A5K3FNR5_MESCO